MANFAVAASPETIEKANKIMEIYAQKLVENFYLEFKR